MVGGVLLQAAICSGCHQALSILPCCRSSVMQVPRQPCSFNMLSSWNFSVFQALKSWKKLFVLRMIEYCWPQCTVMSYWLFWSSYTLHPFWYFLFATFSPFQQSTNYRSIQNQAASSSKGHCSQAEFHTETVCLLVPLAALVKAGFGEPLSWSNAYCSVLSGHFQPQKQGSLHVSLRDVLMNLGLLTFPWITVSDFFFILTPFFFQRVQHTESKLQLYLKYPRLHNFLQMFMLQYFPCVFFPNKIVFFHLLNLQIKWQGRS